MANVNLHYSVGTALNSFSPRTLPPTSQRKIKTVRFKLSSVFQPNLSISDPYISVLA